MLNLLQAKQKTFVWEIPMVLMGWGEREKKQKRPDEDIAAHSDAWQLVPAKMFTHLSDPCMLILYR